MRLIHYTNEKFSLKPKEYPEYEIHWHRKPNGFWVSVEGESDWKSWCEGESFELQNLVVSYEVKLKKDDKILYLKTASDILSFTKKYPYIRDQWDNPEGRRICGSYEIDWLKVKENYQGIIIAPYQWDCRLSTKCSWYYGWDCASGVIWDLDCIEEFNLIEQEITHGSMHMPY